MVPTLNFTRKFSNEKRLGMNFSHTVNAAKCDLGVLARRAVTGRDPVVDLVTMSHGVDRQTLELLARTVCQASAPNAQGLSEEGRDARPGD